MPSHNTPGSSLLIYSLFVFVLIASPVQAADYFPRVYAQGYIGAADFDEDSLTFVEASDTEPATISTSDLSTMPCLGMSAQFALSPEKTHVGIDTSLLLSWSSDDKSVTAGNGRARVKIDSELWLFDLAVGLYAQTVLADRWRIYGAAGPMMVYGDYSDDTTDEDLTVTPHAASQESNTDTAFGVGGYAKLGLEYALSGDAYVGIAVRGMKTNLDFDRAIDDDGLKGIQGFMTFTRVY